MMSGSARSVFSGLKKWTMRSVPCLSARRKWHRVDYTRSMLPRLFPSRRALLAAQVRVISAQHDSGEWLAIRPADLAAHNERCLVVFRCLLRAYHKIRDL